MGLQREQSQTEQGSASLIQTTSLKNNLSGEQSVVDGNCGIQGTQLKDFEGAGDKYGGSEVVF